MLIINYQLASSSVFRKKPQQANDLVMQVLRMQGLETPLLQHRLLNVWDEVVGGVIVRHTGEKYIKNQTLMVKILSPALRADLNMMRTQIKDKLNTRVGAQVIADVRFF